MDIKDIQSELTDFRRQIDELDDRIIELLLARTGIVERVGELKRRTVPGKCPLRPAREAEMVRRIIGKFTGTPFQPAAAAALWRTIIGMSTSIESPLRLSVYTPERNNDLYWLAREYFGAFTPIIRQPQVKRVIGDVMDGKAMIGIVPLLRSTPDNTYWWTNLIQQGSDPLKVFACVPFVYPDPPGRDEPSGLAIGRIAPEPTGDDKSLFVFEADHNVSQSRMQAAFATAKLEATWLSIATLSPHSRHHLLEIKGFITPEHEDMKRLLSALGSSILQVSHLGAYAVPVTLHTNKLPETANAYAAGSGK